MASILVTAGPTHEHLDDVRYLANGSSGRMGYALAEAALGAGHQVVLVTGPTALEAPSEADCRPVTSALEMQAAVDEALRTATPPIDVVVMVAAVADYRPAKRRAGKPKKHQGEVTLRLVPNPDILASLGRRKVAGELDAVLVGFALEAGTHEEIVAKGQKKLAAKHLDLIVVNHTSAMGATSNEVTLLYRDGESRALGRGDKRAVARAILDAALALLPGADAGLHAGDSPDGDSPDGDSPDQGREGQDA